MGGQYQRPRTLTGVLHLPLHYTAQSNFWNDRKIFRHWFLYTFVPLVKEHFRNIGMPEDSKFILLLDNCTAHSREFDLPPGNISVLYLPPNVTPLVQPMDQGVIQNMKLYYRRVFLRKHTNHEGTLKDFQRTYTIRDAVFNVACPWNSMKGKTVRQVWRKLWPAVMTAEVASDEEYFVGFNVRSKDIVHEMVSMFEKLDAWNPECEVSQVDVEEWIDADKGIVVSSTITDEDLINALMNSDPESKILTHLQTKKSPQRKFLWPKLPTRILHFWSCPKAGHVTRHRK